MEKLNILDIIRYTGATVLQKGSYNTFVNDIGTDTRTIKSSHLFLCLVGEHFDGHNFILDAISKGISSFIIDINKWSFIKAKINKSIPEGIIEDKWILGVSNTLIAYQDIARCYLKRFSVIKIGITGSNGKTSTKELLKSLLRNRYETLATKGNLNNQIGVAKTALELEKKHKILIIEMGSGKNGDIKTLSSIVKPDYSIITNIGIAHSEFIGNSSLDIAKEKKDIAYNTTKALILDKDCEHYSFLSSDIKDICIISFSIKDKPLFTIVRSLGLEGYILNYNGKECHFGLFGSYNLVNLHFAILICRELGLSDYDIANGIENAYSLCSSDMRNELVKGKYTIIKDCYNANPSSMIAGLEFFSGLSMNRGLKKICVLGDMRELGVDSRKLHLEIGFFLANQKDNIDYIISLGSLGEFIAKGAVDKGFPASRVFSFVMDKHKALTKISTIISDGDVVYFKASRALALEDIANKLIEKE